MTQKIDSQKELFDESVSSKEVLRARDAGFWKGMFVLENFKQKHMKFLNFLPNLHENEITFAKRGV